MGDYKTLQPAQSDYNIPTANSNKQQLPALPSQKPEEPKQVSFKFIPLTRCTQLPKLPKSKALSKQSSLVRPAPASVSEDFADEEKPRELTDEYVE